MEHVTVYAEPGRFAAWPANYGMWAWGDEIVLVFTSGWLGSPGPGLHAVDGSRGFETVQVRSGDGGLSWHREPFTGAIPSPAGLSVDEHLPASMRLDAVGELGAVTPGLDEAGLDLADPGVVVMAGRTGLHAGSISWLYASRDRCRTWLGPYGLPDFGVPGVAARTDVVRLGPGDLLLLLTAAKSDGREGRVFAARSTDGGRTFVRSGWLGAEPSEPGAYAIMPATVVLPDGTLRTAVRRSEPAGSGSGTSGADRKDWIELYGSADAGESWSLVCPTAAETGPGGNPPTLTRLDDGRLCLAYGYRAEPFGIRARTSEDDGRGWGAEIVLRDDGGCGDLGYPRTVTRADGALVTAYYFNDARDGERYIAATVWRP